MAEEEECSKTHAVVLEEHRINTVPHVSTAMPVLLLLSLYRKALSYKTFQKTTTMPSAHASCDVFSACHHQSRPAVAFLPYLVDELVITGNLVAQVLRRWLWRFYCPIERVLCPSPSSKRRVHSLSIAIPLILLMTVSSNPTRPVPFIEDVQRGPGPVPLHLSDHFLFTFPMTKAPYTAGGTVLPYKSRQPSTGRVTTKTKGREISSQSAHSSSRSAVDAASSDRNGIAEILWSKVTGSVSYGSQLFPGFVLLANAAEELPKKEQQQQQLQQGVEAASANTGRSTSASASDEEESADSESQEEATSVEDSTPWPVSRAGTRFCGSPQASTVESLAETAKTRAASTTTTIAEADTSDKQQVSASHRANPFCPTMSKVPGASLAEHTHEQLCCGTKQQQEDVVRQLSRAHVTPWSHLPLDVIQVQRLPGGLTNRLYVVKLRRSACRVFGAAEAESQPETPEGQQQEIRDNDRQPSHHVEDAAVERGALRGNREETTSEHGEMITDGASLTCSEKICVQTDLIRPQKILFRVFGQPSSLRLFDPDDERHLFRLLSKAGFAPRCFAEFSSGRVEEWIEGKALHVDELHLPEIQDMVASALSAFHRSDVGYGRISPTSQIGRRCPWRQLLPSLKHVSKAQQQQRQQQQAEQREHRTKEATPAQHLPAASVEHSPHQDHHHHHYGDDAGTLPQDIIQPDSQSCICSFCRGHAWAALAKVAAAEMEAAAVSAETHANAVRSSYHPGSTVHAGSRPEAHTSAAEEMASGDARKETIEASSTGGVSTGHHATIKETGDIARGREDFHAAAAIARATRESVHACAQLNLEKYAQEVYLVQKAVQDQLMRELDPEELQRVYGGIDNWLLLSGGSPVLSHNDLQENNIMNSPDGVKLIDFEYAGENARAADLANLFCEMAINYTDLQVAPFFSIDPSRFPSADIMRSIIRKYLRASLLQQFKGDEKQGKGGEGGAVLSAEEEEKLRGRVSDQIVSNFETMTRLFTLMSHLNWAFWSVVKAPLQQPSDEFNYLKYAEQRLRLYDLQKEEFLRPTVTLGVSPR